MGTVAGSVGHISLFILSFSISLPVHVFGVVVLEGGGVCLAVQDWGLGFWSYISFLGRQVR